MEIARGNGVLSVTTDLRRTMFLSMKFPRFDLSQWLGRTMVVCLLAGSSWVQAQDQVEVRGATFSLVRAPLGTTEHWQAMSVSLQARPDRLRLGHVTDRVKVKVSIGYEHGLAGGKREWQFYRASVDLVGLRSGRSTVRFYLPPEIVKRDELQGGPKFWAVELVGEEMDVSPTRRNYSLALKDERMLSQFMDKVSNEGAANDGFLQPQHLTPFATLDPDNTATVVQPTSWR